MDKTCSGRLAVIRLRGVTDDADKPDVPPSRRLAELLGLPEPKPFTEEEERAYQQWLADGDAQVEAIIARRRQRAA
ncbi:hypothetical protein Ait01nite_012950 [Actinoplanes italicus]|uniref:Uncharacterized protein n=1 Tax=Actinoplanes italicus TaxID=113567 RepID=A0A2T0KH30_9ACTN|nr:hypothetical protein CLV67_104256 [Actinoplanes italicus]GIE28250.1 hypothetical protein Ait01nite_012950 [Actinoplanes italicus]